MNKSMVEKGVILACVSPSPTSRKLIKIASQIANSSKSDFFAVTVTKGKNKENNSVNSAGENLKYAELLGAKSEVLNGRSLAKTIAVFAKEKNVSQLIIGKSIPKNQSSIEKRRLLKELKALLPDTKIITIPNPMPSYGGKSESKKLKVSFKDIIISLGILAVTTLLCWWFNKIGFTDATLITVYILAVLLISFFTNGYICSAVSSVLSVTIFNYLFTVPFFSLKSYGTGYPVTLVVMFLAAFLTSSLTVQVKKQAQQHAQNAYRTEMLLGANRKLQKATNESEIFRAAAEQIQKLLLRSVILYPAIANKLSEPILIPAGESENELLECTEKPEEKAIAEWVLSNNIQGGATTGIFNDSQFWYLAVRMNENDNICAVAGIRMKKDEWIDSSDKNLLLAMLGECAVAIEKERLNRSSEEYALQVKQEQLRSNLLRSISHDLRTPLTTISGNANMLMSGSVAVEKDKQQLYSDIYDDSVWLIDLVENLLSITRLDSGNLNINMQPQDISDIIDAAVSHVQSRIKNHKIKIVKPDELLIVNADSSLIVQLLNNLIENAFKYAGENRTIEISAKKGGNSAVLSVADDGEGIPDEEKEKVFDMFYTVQSHSSSDDRRGLGLGLALCKTIALSHQGSIELSDNIPHGAVFSIKLPLMEVKND